MTGATYVQRTDGEGWAIRNRVPFRISCCSCGLVHNVVVTVSGKRKGTWIGIAAERNNRATGQKRHKKDKLAQPIPEVKP
jgi:hypothetical protein